MALARSLVVGLLLGALLGLRSSAAEGPAGAPLQVRFQPADLVYLWENNGEGTPRELYTAVLQNFAIVNRSKEPVELDEVVIEALRGDEVELSVTLRAGALDDAALRFQALERQQVLEAYDFHFQLSRYLEGVPLAKSRSLQPAQALVVTSRALLFQSVPDTLRVSVVGRGAGDTFVSGSGALRVVLHESKNTYGFPVRGRWLVAAAPSLHGHHRWASNQEFALDLVRIGDGGLSHRSDGSKLSQYYAYGESVVAAADGKVVAAADGIPDLDSALQQPDETDRQYFARTLRTQNALLAKGFAAAMGNHVILEHPNGEWTSYLHLKDGSIVVKVGDTVKRGQAIGAVGGSGNSTEPHLHFQVSDGADLGYSRAVPVEFDDLRLWPAVDTSVRHLQSGQIVETLETEKPPKAR